MKTVIVVCPNCFKVFKTYGGPLTVITAYRAAAGIGWHTGKNKDWQRICGIFHSHLVSSENGSI
ncbi:MAG: hypothetical protein R2860_01385 [Desulfobacterales bacterium]